MLNCQAVQSSLNFIASRYRWSLGGFGSDLHKPSNATSLCLFHQLQHATTACGIFWSQFFFWGRAVRSELGLAGRVLVYVHGVIFCLAISYSRKPKASLCFFAFTPSVLSLVFLCIFFHVDFFMLLHSAILLPFSCCQVNTLTYVLRSKPWWICGIVLDWMHGKAPLSIFVLNPACLILFVCQEGAISDVYSHFIPAWCSYVLGF